jgi:rhamnosyltransferase
MHRRHGDNVSESHRLKLSPVEIIKQGTIGFNQLAENYAKVYSQTLFEMSYLRQHKLNARVLDEAEAVIRNGGIKGVRFFWSHGVKRKQKSKTLAIYLVLLTKKYQKYLIS